MPDNVLRPFKLSVPESVLEDLRQRLLNVRLPDEPPLNPWSTGTSVDYLKELLAYCESACNNDPPLAVIGIQN